MRSGQRHDGSGIVETRGISGSHGEALYLRMYDPQCGKGFQTAVAARMLVLGEDGGGAVGLRHVNRNDLIDERSGVDGFDRVLVAPHGPLVLRPPGDAVLNRAVVPNRDRHVDCRSLRSWR